MRVLLVDASGLVAWTSFCFCGLSSCCFAGWASSNPPWRLCASLKPNNSRFALLFSVSARSCNPPLCPLLTKSQHHSHFSHFLVVVIFAAGVPYCGCDSAPGQRVVHAGRQRARFQRHQHKVSSALSEPASLRSGCRVNCDVCVDCCRGCCCEPKCNREPSQSERSLNCELRSSL